MRHGEAQYNKWQEVFGLVLAFAVLEGKADAECKKLIEASLDKCKALFRQWVATFKRDEYEDEWDLF